METLFIRITAPARPVGDAWVLDAVEWCVLDADGQLTKQGTGTASDLADLVNESLRTEPDRVVAAIPGEFCLSLQAKVPGRSAGQIRRALPFVIEEFLASDIDDVHIAYGAIRRNAPIDCIAVERGLLNDWRTALTNAGIVPGAMLSDAELLPRGDDEITLFFDDQRILVRTPHQSFVAEPDTLALALTGAMEQLTSDAPVTIRCIGGSLSELERAQIDQSAPVPLGWERADTEAPGFLALIRLWQQGGAGTNLLQGDYTPPRQHNPHWQRWRSVAALAGIWFVLALGVQAGQAIWADHRAAEVEQEIRTVYRTYFPDDPRATTRPLEGIRSQLAQHIGAGTGHSGFLALTTVLAESLPADDGAALRGLTYNDARLELAVDVNARDFAALDQLRDRLASAGLSVDISSAEQQDQHVRARLRLRG